MEEKFLKLDKKDLEEIDEDIKRNRKDRMRFIDQYTEWLKKTPNKKWSKQQNKIISHEH
jgi:ParB-like chromosome segregation protein Spo0J